MSTLWQDEAFVFGIKVKATFFDAQAAENKKDLTERLLPFFKEAKPKVLVTEADRRNFYADDLVAQPDVVLEHNGGLICVEYKSISGRQHDVGQWRSQLRAKDVLQCLFAGFAVAQTSKQLTACILRYPNVAYLLSPPDVMMAS